MHPMHRLARAAGVALACSLSLLISSAAAAAPAQDSQRSVTISGTLEDHQGGAVPGVTIQLKSVSCKCSECKDKKACDCCPDQRQVTNADGTFTFDVGSGIYQVMAKIKGAEVSAKVDVTSGDSKDVTLRAKQ